MDEVERMLIPLLKREKSSSAVWTKETHALLVVCRERLSRYLLPLTEREISFLDHFYDRREIEPSLLTDDPSLIDKIRHLPGLKWTLRKFAMNDS